MRNLGVLVLGVSGLSMRGGYIYGRDNRLLTRLVLDSVRGVRTSCSIYYPVGVHSGRYTEVSILLSLCQRFSSKGLWERVRGKELCRRQGRLAGTSGESMCRDDDRQGFRGVHLRHTHRS